MSEVLIHKELSGNIIGAAMSVLNELKPGLDEKLYERALVIALRELGHFVDQQKRFDVLFHGNWVGALVPDLIVDGLIVVDTKVVTTFTETHFAKMIGYLTITGLDLALLLNFKFARLQWKRVAFTSRKDPEGDRSDDPSY